MRHSDIKLTMGTYTDPEFLDVAGAMATLPALPPGGPRTPSDTTSTAGFGCPWASPGGMTGMTERTSPDTPGMVEMCCPDNGNGSVTFADAEPMERVTDGIRTRDIQNHNLAL